jgi:hypothetical protein
MISGNETRMFSYLVKMVGSTGRFALRFLGNVGLRRPTSADIAIAYVSKSSCLEQTALSARLL